MQQKHVLGYDFLRLMVVAEHELSPEQYLLHKLLMYAVSNIPMHDAELSPCMVCAEYKDKDTLYS